MGGAVFHQVLSRFLLWRSVPEIFAIKVESCQKLCQILTFFALPNLLGAGLPKVVHKLSRLPPSTSHGKVSWGYTPTNPKVIGAHTLNFKPNVKCSPLKFLGDPIPHLECALAILCQSLPHIKICGASTPQGLNIVSWKVDFGASKLTSPSTL